jgi:hypothetical protein
MNKLPDFPLWQVISGGELEVSIEVTTQTQHKRKIPAQQHKSSDHNFSEEKRTGGTQTNMGGACFGYRWHVEGTPMFLPSPLFATF